MPERIKEAVGLGLRVFGENRVQEAQKKIEQCKEECADCQVEWHMIGHLQKNKAKTAVRLFDLIHSIDSIGLAEEVNTCASKENKVQKVLIEVKLSEEETKHGVRQERLHGINRGSSDYEEPETRRTDDYPPFF